MTSESPLDAREALGGLVDVVHRVPEFVPSHYPHRRQDFGCWTMLGAGGGLSRTCDQGLDFAVSIPRKAPQEEHTFRNCRHTEAS